MKWVYANTPEPMVSELRPSHPGEPRYVLSIIRIFYKVNWLVIQELYIGYTFIRQ
jgi:hypothetical protein